MIAVLLAVAALAPSADAPVASYCSRSGDLCYGIARRDGAVVFKLDTFARYFNRYTLCVRAPDARTRCGSFPIFRRGTLYGSTVRWARNYPNAGPGVYRVSWRLGTQPLGPTLRFRR